MASFEIADCPTKVQLAEQDKAGKKTQTGTLTLTVRNATDGQRTGRVKVEPDQGAKPDWFALQGAAATNPREFEQDFAARGTQTIRVTVTVPAGEAAKSCLFRLVVTDERDPDNDFVKGPNVAFDIKEWKQVPPPPFPWWIFVAAGVVVLLVVGGVVAYLLIPGGPPQVEVAGLTADAAKKKLVDAGFVEANIATANDSQASGHQRGTVTHADYPDKTHVNLFLDPGGPPQLEVAGLTADVAKKNLVAAGFAEANIATAYDRQTSRHPRDTVTSAAFPDQTHVNLFLDPGPSQIPVAGLTADAARKQLLDAGFADANIAPAWDSHTSGHQRGTVTHAVYPDPTHVNLFLDPGPSQIAVAGLTADAAKKDLVVAGFAEANIATAYDRQTSGHQRNTVTRADYPDPTHVNLFLDPGPTPTRVWATVDKCPGGTVYRNAFAEDHICVSPEEALQTLADNNARYVRIQPGGGPYGPETCRQGFVWREAIPTDRVCVTPAVRTRTAQENRGASWRLE